MAEQYGALAAPQGAEPTAPAQYGQGPPLPFNPMSTLLSLFLAPTMGMDPGMAAITGMLLGGSPPSQVPDYIPPSEQPLDPYDVEYTRSLAGPDTMWSERGLLNALQELPEDERPFFMASLEQSAAVNALNRQYYNDWMDHINRSYQGAADVLAAPGRTAPRALPAGG